jgi:hypothetical protein
MRQAPGNAGYPALLLSDWPVSAYDSEKYRNNGDHQKHMDYSAGMESNESYQPCNDQDYRYDIK